MPAAARARGGVQHDALLRFRIGPRRSCTALLILLASAIGCDQAAPRGHVERLVDPHHRAAMVADFGRGPVAVPASPLTGRPSTSTSGYPRARVDDDTRLVLAAPASGILIMRPRLEVAPTGAFRETVVISDALAGSSRLLLTPRVQLGSNWTDLPTRIVAVDKHQGGPTVTVDLQLPEAMAGRTVQLVVTSTAIDWGPQTSLRTAPLQIPKHARLDLATAVLEPGWKQGPTLFMVEACEEEACQPLYETSMDPRQEADRHWRDASVALDPYAGKTVTMVFRSKLSPVSTEEFSLPAWANPTVRVPRKADKSAPNVVLLSIGALSARHLPTYGYFRDTAPILGKEFELGGTVFDNCMAAATSNPQAHMSMFTGLQPLEHGIKTGLEVLDLRIETVAEQIRAAGVTTGAFTEEGRLESERGFGRGFDEHKERRTTDTKASPSQIDKRFAAAEAWLKRHADERFFLFLQTQLHSPHVLPSAYTGLFSTDEQDAVIDESSPAHVREAQRYDRAIRYVDDELGALLTAINGLGLSDDTVFMVVSDHGKAFLEHGFLGHGSFFYEEVIHVPLLMRGPGIPPGLHVDAPVSHVDLANTIASFFAVEPPRGSRGTDLRRTFRDNGAAVDGAFYFAESWGDSAIGTDKARIRFLPPAFAARQGQRKVARYNTEDGSHWSECYDLATDPDERTNLCTDLTSEPADLAATLDAYQVTTARRRADLLSTTDRQGEDPQMAPLDPAREKMSP